MNNVNNFDRGAEDFRTLLLNITVGMRKQGIEVTKDLGLTSAEGHILAELAAAEGEVQTQKALAQATRMAPSALTRSIGPLVERGLVVREESGTDARQKRVVLTPDGRDVVNQFQQRLQSVENDLTSCLTDEEMTTLTALLGKLANHIHTQK